MFFGIIECRNLVCKEVAFSRAKCQDLRCLIQLNIYNYHETKSLPRPVLLVDGPAVTWLRLLRGAPNQDASCSCDAIDKFPGPPP